MAQEGEVEERVGANLAILTASGGNIWLASRSRLAPMLEGWLEHCSNQQKVNHSEQQLVTRYAPIGCINCELNQIVAMSKQLEQRPTPNTNSK